MSSWCRIVDADLRDREAPMTGSFRTIVNRDLYREAEMGLCVKAEEGRGQLAEQPPYESDNAYACIAKSH